MVPGRGTPIGQRETFVGDQSVAPTAPRQTLGCDVATVRHPHVWVLTDPGTGASCPGLAVEQRRDPITGSWLVNVVIVEDRDGAPVTVQGWVPAQRVRRAT